MSARAQLTKRCGGVEAKSARSERHTTAARPDRRFDHTSVSIARSPTPILPSTRSPRSRRCTSPQTCRCGSPLAMATAQSTIHHNHRRTTRLLGSIGSRCCGSTQEARARPRVVPCGFVRSVRPRPRQHPPSCRSVVRLPLVVRSGSTRS